MIFTIGYAQFSIDAFLDTLRKYDISAIADVRSAPFSKYKPDFIKDKIQKHLGRNHMAYLFLGDMLGARIKDPAVYLDNKLSYELLSKSDFWTKGINKLLDESGKYRLAIMCAEKDPLHCHRTFLICRTLRSFSLRIHHILEEGSLEEHADTEKRILENYGLEQSDIFRSESDILEDAYDRMCEKIVLTP